MPRRRVYKVLHALQSHLSPPGLTVVQVAQVENSQEQVAKVEILVQSLGEKTAHTFSCFAKH